MIKSAFKLTFRIPQVLKTIPNSQFGIVSSLFLRDFSSNNLVQSSKDGKRIDFSKINVSDFIDEGWPVVLKDLKEFSKRFEAKTAPKLFGKALDYNRFNGLELSALFFLHAYKNVASDLTEEKMKLARILGWCFELAMVSILIFDDVADSSDTRYTKKCWYKLDDVGMSALHDAVMVENGIYHLLRKYFCDKDYYVDLLHMFHEIQFAVATGQLLDAKTTGQDVTTFTEEQYHSFVDNKTSFMLGQMVNAALIMSGYKDEKIFCQIKPIFTEIGRLLQGVDDYHDCFGKGTTGNDIAQGKITWLSLCAMKKGNNVQKELMKLCYGQKDPQNVKHIQKLYLDLKIKEEYEKFEECAMKKLLKDFEAVPDKKLQNFMVACVRKIKKRPL